MSTTSRAAFNFFREHAGGVVGQCALGALNLARAEEYALEHGWIVEWQPDEDPDLGDHEVWCATARQEKHKPPTGWVGRQYAHTHEVLWCGLLDSEGQMIASLGNIIDPTRAYARVVEAELALEALSEIQRAAQADVESGRYLAL